MPRNSPNNPSRKKVNFTPCSISAADAQLAYLAMKPKPSLRRLAVILKEQGHKISEGTIIKWCRRHRWNEALVVNRARRESDIIAVLEVMSAEGQRLTPDIVSGVQARLMAHLGGALAKVECKTPADVVLLLEACEKLRGLSHTVRGDQFGEVRKTGDTVTQGAQVTLGKFTPKVVGGKPNGGQANNGNGEAHE